MENVLYLSSNDEPFVPFQLRFTRSLAHPALCLDRVLSLNRECIDYKDNTEAKASRLDARANIDQIPPVNCVLPAQKYTAPFRSPFYCSLSYVRK